MDIEDSISKLLSPVETHSGLIGAGLGALYSYKNSNSMDSVNRLLNGEIHFPDIKEFLGTLLSDPSLVAAAVVAVGGWLVKEGTNNPTVKKIAGIAQGGGTGYAAVLLAMQALYSMTHSDPPSSDNSSQSSGSLQMIRSA